MKNKYMVNEIFYSLQGEGARVGDPSIFIRFTGCNLKCDGGTDEFGAPQPVCDTEFQSGLLLTLEEIDTAIEAAIMAAGNADTSPQWIVLTGGEPTLQIDPPLIDFLKGKGFKLAIETNGLKPIPEGIDWITVSPKTAEHTLKVEQATELRYVRAAGQGIPRPAIPAMYHWLSPHFDASSPAATRQNIRHCINLCLQNPRWRLSVQQHKLWEVR